MLTARIKIGGYSTTDTQAYGLVYLSADNIVGPQQKGFEKTEYPEQEGENLMPVSVDAPFDYKVKFFIKADSVKNANEIISEFNERLYTKVGDVKTYRQVTFYNDYRRVKIVGYPKEISSCDDFWRDPSGQVNDVVVVEWTIRVDKPSLCDFNL